MQRPNKGGLAVRSQVIAGLDAVAQCRGPAVGVEGRRIVKAAVDGHLQVNNRVGKKHFKSTSPVVPATKRCTLRIM